MVPAVMDAGCFVGGNRSYTVSVPTLPGCITYGENIPDAIAMAREAIDLFIESLVAHGEDIPSEEGTLEYTITVPVYA